MKFNSLSTQMLKDKIKKNHLQKKKTKKKLNSIKLTCKISNLGYEIEIT
jgi:hypothetical protein